MADLDRALRFYRDGLGWPVRESGDQVAFIQLETVVLSLYPRHLLAEDANLPDEGSGSAFGGITLAHNVASKDEVDAALGDAVAAGATLLKQAADAFWGGYSGYFADPDGYPWEVAWNPFFPLSETGRVTLPEQEDD